MQKYKLTYPQQNIWLVDKFSKKLPINSIVGTVEIEKNFDENVCNEAINYVIKNNDAMRINIIDEEEILQYVKEFEYEKFEVVKLEMYSDEEKSEYINNCVLLPLLLDKNKLYEFKILDYGKGRGAIFMKIHHIISDAWSCSKIGTSLIDYMEKKSNNEELNDELKPSYIEFIKKEEEYEKSEKFLKDEVFWDEYLEGVKESITLKKSHNTLSKNAKRYTVDLDYNLNQDISQFCKENKVSIYSLFLAALSIYIKRIENLNDFNIGTPVLNRSNFKEKQILGMFVSTIPLRIILDDNDTFFDVVSKIGANTMSVFRHQKYPYKKILENYRKKNKNKENLYKIALSYQNARVEHDKGYSTTWKFSNCIEDDLDIHIEDMSNTGLLKIHYDYLCDLFDEIEIKYLHSRLITIIKNGILDKSKLINEISIISKYEKNKIINDFNNTEVDFPNDKTYIELFDEQVLKTPNNTAIVFQNKKLSYKELSDKVNSLAYFLKNEKNVKKGSKICLLLKRNFDMLISILAVIKIGGVYVPIDPDFPEDRINYMIENSESSLVIKSSSIKFESNKDFTIDNFDYSKYDNKIVENCSNINDLIYIIYTSGTTGKPKGVMINHSNVVNLCFAANLFQKLDECKVWGGFSSYSFDISIFETLVPLAFGKKIILANEEEQKIPEKMFDLIKKYKIEVVYMTPTRMQLLINYDKNGEAIQNFKRILLGGEEFPKNYFEILRGFTDAKIYDGYGPTEITVWSSAKEIEKKDEINIGYSIPNVFSYILDEQNNLLPIGCKGELCIGGKGVGVGYYKNKEATDEKFIKLEGKRLYKTGDIAYFNFNGELEYVGRKDSQIKLRGLRIEIEEIESAIKSYDNVIQSAVVVIDNKLYAYFSSDKSIAQDELKKYLRTKLPRYMVPTFYMQVKKFEFTVLGKIDKSKLPKIKVKIVSYVEPRNEIEKKISSEVSILLNIEKVGIDDNLFELGLDSLNAINLITKLSREKIKLTYGNIYDYPTIRELNDFLENNKIKELYGSINEYDYSKIDNTLIKNKLENIDDKVEKEDLGDIVIAGVTGFLGMHILYEFLKNESGNVYCLIRKKSGQNPKERIKSRLNFYFNGEYIEQIGKRIKILEADIEKENLGLNERNLNELIQNTATFINTASRVTHFGDEEIFQKVNVQSSKSIADFCLKNNKKLIYISTLSVSGNVLEGGYIEQSNIKEKIIYNETKLFVNQKLNNIYIYTKFLAERYLLEQKEKGLNVKIMRMGNLTNRSSDNKFQVNAEENMFANRIKTLLKIKVLPKNLEDFYLEFTPVDFAAHTIINLSKTNRKYTMFHLFNHNHVPLKRFIQILRKMDVNVRFISEDEFAKKMEKYMSDEKKSEDISGIIIDLNKDNKLNYLTNITIKSYYTIEILNKIGIKWPEIDDTYISKYIKKFM